MSVSPLALSVNRVSCTTDRSRTVSPPLLEGTRRPPTAGDPSIHPSIGPDSRHHRADHLMMSSLHCEHGALRYSFCVRSYFLTFRPCRERLRLQVPLTGLVSRRPPPVDAVVTAVDFTRFAYIEMNVSYSLLKRNEMVLYRNRKSG